MSDDDKFDQNWSWRKGRDKKGKPPKRAIDGYSEGMDPLEKAGSKNACLTCPASLACLTMPAARENGRRGQRRKDWSQPIRAHLHWCPMCKRNYFQVKHGDGVGDSKRTEEIDVDPLCPALLDFEDKQQHSVVCWKCRHEYKENVSPGSTTISLKM